MKRKLATEKKPAQAAGKKDFKGKGNADNNNSKGFNNKGTVAGNKRKAFDKDARNGAAPMKKKKTTGFNFASGKKQELDLSIDPNAEKQENQEEEGSKPKLTPEEKKALSRKEQKQRQQERKAAKPHGDIIYEAKVLWNKVLPKRLTKEERTANLNKLMKLIEGKIFDITFKHDASRIVQTCVKYGTPEQRQKIIDELKEHFVPLAKSRFGHHMLKKIFKYATKPQIPELLKPLNGNFRSLLKHKEASTVVEYLYADICNAAQRTSIIQEFYGPEFAIFKSGEVRNLDTILAEEPLKKTSILRHIKESADALINKGLLHHSIIHRLFLDYISHSEPKNTLEMVSNLKERLPEILHTREGAKVAFHCLSYSSVKDRKAIVKSFKGLVKKICLEEYGHTVILRALDVIDDTVLTKKGILAEIIADLQEIILDKHGRLAVLHILSPRNTRYFSADLISQLQPAFLPGENGEEVPTSKKAPELRRQELLAAISDSLLQLCASQTETLINSPQGRDVLFETLKEAKGKKDPAFQAVLNLVATEDIESSLNCHQVGHRTIKRLVHESVQMEDGSEFASALLTAIEGRLAEFAVKKNASFVVMSLLEHSSTAEKTSKLLRQSLKVNEKSDQLDAGTKLILQTLNKNATSAATKSPAPKSPAPSTPKANAKKSTPAKPPVSTPKATPKRKRA